MEFTIIAEGQPPFHFAPATRKPVLGQDVCQSGGLCPAARMAGGCRATAAAIPVLDAFSRITSYEGVRVVRHSGEQAEVFEETGQRAALRLLVAALNHSGCPFFGRFSPLPEDGPLSRTYAAFVRAARAMLHDSEADTVVETADHVGLILDEVEGIGRQVEDHLQPLLREARRRCDKDAAVNAVVLLFSGSRLACEHLQEEAGSAHPVWEDVPPPGMAPCMYGAGSFTAA